ncbi:hypothetical protein BHE74_00016059, partial [Ensete ventricosum]
HLLSFSVVLECESLFFGRRSPELPVRLPCPLNISLAIPNPGKDLRDVEWSGVEIRAAARRLWRCPFTFCT